MTLYPTGLPIDIDRYPCPVKDLLNDTAIDYAKAFTSYIYVFLVYFLIDITIMLKVLPTNFTMQVPLFS